MKQYELESHREAQAEHRKWEDSLEGVAYWLGDLPVPESLETVIIKAVHRLPLAGREFVFCNCRFALSDEGGVRIHYVPRTRQPWLITLPEGLVDESVIIHEIAHAWLGHAYDLHRGEWRVCPREEQAACDLTRQWGFAGSGSESFG